MQKLVFTCLLCFSILVARSQSTYPVNGPHNITSEYYALTHATLFIDYQTRINDATLIIKDGRVIASGTNIPIPKEAMLINMNQQFIYPAFIDLYTDYGMQWKPEKKVGGEQQQFLSNKEGAYAWNEAIRAEIKASELFHYDEPRARKLRESGFGVVMSGIQDGICRGSSVLVLTSDKKENELILVPEIAAGYSFEKGSSTQNYPSSLMGSIALLRQTYYDAQWYLSQEKEQNLTLAAFNKLKTLPAIFSVNDKLSIIRADKIGDEMNAVYIVKGAGDEYQRVDEIKAANVSLIIPINFPKPYEVDDPLEANLVSTADLKHWEDAPYNPGVLSKAQMEFAITAQGCDDAATFLKNLRKAVRYGLDEKQALKSLTETPAKLIRKEKELGALRKGMYANFIVCNGSLFDKETQILETWSGGKKFITKKQDVISLLGNYAVDMKEYRSFLIKGTMASPTISMIGKDTIKGTLQKDENLYQVQFKMKDQYLRITAWFTQIDSSVYPFQLKQWKGIAEWPTGEKMNFAANWTSSAKADSVKKDSVNISPMLPVVYPFNDYGWNTEPKQETIIFRNATVWTNEEDSILKETDVAIQNGKIVAVGKKLSLAGAIEIDATGKQLTSGIIDEHSHIAITQGVNEGTQSVTSEVRIGDVVYSEDINIYRQLSGGVTAAQLLHGSANAIGGQSALVKLRWGASPEKMKIENAPKFIKFALGENVKQSNWGDRAVTRYPQTRMGVEQTVLDAFTRAKEYEKKLKENPKLTRKDLELDALVEILHKERNITCHSYVQSEINMLMHLADSMGFKVNTFTHILEGYKVADKMKQHGANASTFADWWAYKYEVIEAIPYNAAILTKMGVTTAINSDDAEMGRRLNQEAAKVVKYGNISEVEAWKMVTLNPAKMLHLDNRMGSIKAGKDADLVLWNDHPLSIYAKPLMTFVDGRCYFDRAKDERMRTEIAKERARIIQKMIDEKAKGEKTEKKISKQQEVYLCDTE